MRCNNGPMPLGGTDVERFERARAQRLPARAAPSVAVHHRRRARVALRRRWSHAADDEQVPLNARFLAFARAADAAGMARALNEGAAVNSRNRLGESALVIVLKQNRVDLATVLVAAGADVNLAAVNGITPLMAAAYGGQTEFVGVLLDKGADVDAVDRLQKNAMTYAAGEGHTAIVKLLLARGVDPNAVYRNDLTALMWAAGYGRRRHDARAARRRRASPASRTTAARPRSTSRARTRRRPP